MAVGEAFILEGNYGVYFSDKLCGKVQVLRQGLYYLFVCRCQLSGDVICRLTAVFQDREQQLGVLIPMDDGFGLRTKIPIKYFSGRPVKFKASAKNDIFTGFFAPIYPEEPFQYIEKLKDAYLSKKDGQIGIYVK